MYRYDCMRLRMLCRGHATVVTRLSSDLSRDRSKGVPLRELYAGLTGRPRADDRRCDAYGSSIRCKVDSITGFADCGSGNRRRRTQQEAKLFDDVTAQGEQDGEPWCPPRGCSVEPVHAFNTESSQEPSSQVSSHVYFGDSSQKDK
eukprot:COSAG05_NODE_4043_length_1703_cov_2.033666_1_plen_146_part_00